MSTRLNKYLSQAGICSRRQADEAIAQGRVELNGAVVVELGVQVDPAHDVVVYDGMRVETKRHDIVCLVINKPRGVVSTLADPHADKTVASLAPARFGRLFPVGRLDKDSQGLILMTNDGALANRLTHPSFGIEKEYIVTTDRALKTFEVRKLEEGELRLSDGRLAGKIRVGEAEKSRHGNRRYYLILREGRNREIRELMEALGLDVKRLKRVRMGPIVLGNVPIGGWRQLTSDEERALAEAAPDPAEKKARAEAKAAARVDRGRPGSRKAIAARTRRPKAPPQPAAPPASGNRWAELRAGAEPESTPSPSGGRPARGRGPASAPPGKTPPGKAPTPTGRAPKRPASRPFKPARAATAKAAGAPPANPPAKPFAKPPARSGAKSSAPRGGGRSGARQGTRTAPKVGPRSGAKGGLKRGPKGGGR